MFLAEEIKIGLANRFRRIVQTQMTGKRQVDLGKTALSILEVNSIRNVSQERSKGIAFVCQLLFRLLAPGDVLIGAQHPNHAAILVKQRHFAGRQPQLGSVQLGLEFVVVEFGLARVKHLLVVGAVVVSHRLPGRLVVALADKFIRVAITTIVSKALVATQKIQVPILPENTLRNGIQYQT